MEHSAENIWNFTHETEELALLSEPIEFDQVFQPLQRYLLELFVRYDVCIIERLIHKDTFLWFFNEFPLSRTRQL